MHTRSLLLFLAAIFALHLAPAVESHAQSPQKVSQIIEDYGTYYLLIYGELDVNGRLRLPQAGYPKFVPLAPAEAAGRAAAQAAAGSAEAAAVTTTGGALTATCRATALDVQVSVEGVPLLPQVAGNRTISGAWGWVMPYHDLLPSAFPTSATYPAVLSVGCDELLPLATVGEQACRDYVEAEIVQYGFFYNMTCGQVFGGPPSAQTGLCEQWVSDCLFNSTMMCAESGAFSPASPGANVVAGNAVVEHIGVSWIDGQYTGGAQVPAPLHCPIAMPGPIAAPTPTMSPTTPMPYMPPGSFPIPTY